MAGCTVSAATPASTGRTRSRSPTTRSSAERIFLNVGGRAARPPSSRRPRRAHPRPTATCCELDACPEHLVVVGGSYIGLEFAQIFRRFGSEVTVVEKGRG